MRLSNLIYMYYAYKPLKIRYLRLKSNSTDQIYEDGSVIRYTQLVIHNACGAVATLLEHLYTL